MPPSESHAWFRAASRSTLCAIHRQGAEAADYWERLHCSDAAIAAAARVATELAIIVACFPEEPRLALRPSWEQ